jgi:hypothetical protein
MAAASRGEAVVTSKTEQEDYTGPAEKTISPSNI